jgi:hypothetical protein
MSYFLTVVLWFVLQQVFEGKKANANLFASVMSPKKTLNSVIQD